MQMRMRHILFSSLDSPALQYVGTLSKKEHDFRKKFTEQKKSVLVFSAFSV